MTFAAPTALLDDAGLLVEVSVSRLQDKFGAHEYLHLASRLQAAKSACHIRFTDKRTLGAER